MRTLSPHFNAVAPRCPSFGPCGGCSLQSLEYDAQLREKQRQVGACGEGECGGCGGWKVRRSRGRSSDRCGVVGVVGKCGGCGGWKARRKVSGRVGDLWAMEGEAQPLQASSITSGLSYRSNT